MLREKTQRRLFRLLFVLGCVLPTLAVGGLATARLTPVYRGFLLDAVGGAAGVRLTADAIATPKPGVYVVTGLSVANQTTGETIANCDRLRLKSFAGKWSANADRFELVVSGQDSRSGRHLARSSSEITATIGELLLTGPDGKPCGQWAGVNAHYHTDDRGFHLEAAGNGAAKLSISGTEPNEVRVAFDTGSTAIDAVGITGDSLSSLPAETRFIGRGEVVLSGGSSTGRFSGEVRANHAAPSNTFGFAEWESAVFRVHEAEWAGSVIGRFVADVELRSASLRRSLVWGLCQRLGCGATADLSEIYAAATEQPIGFDRLAGRVTLNPSGIKIEGGLPDGVLGAVGGTALLVEPTSGPVPLTAMVQALWPFAAPELPATVEARAVATRLPLPSAETVR